MRNQNVKDSSFSLALDVPTVIRLLFLIGAVLVTGNNSVHAQGTCSASPLLRVGPADGGPLDRLGASAELSGNIAFIGAPGRVNQNPNLPAFSHTGAVYIARRNGSSWTLDSTLLWAPDGAHGDSFGEAMSVNGAWLAVAAPNADSFAGAVYMFQSNADGSVWAYRQKLLPPVRAASEYFGQSVSISGSSLVVGAYGASLSTGKVYAYHFNGSSWTWVQTIQSPDAASYDFFGYSLAQSDNVMLVGAYGDDFIGTNSGSVYVYRTSNGGASWSYSQTFRPSSPAYATGSSFGTSVAFANGMAVVGALGDDNGAGAAYIYRSSNGSSFQEEARIVASDQKPSDRFGSKVATDGSRILVGVMNWRNLANYSIQQGKAYLFAKDGALWQEKLTLIQPSPWGMDGDYFGSAVALSGSTAVAGAPGENPPATVDSGKAYFFDVTCSGSAPTIVSSSPPNNFIDALEDKDASSGTLYGVSAISITFSAPVKNASSGAALSVTNFERKYFRAGAEITQAPYDLATGTAPTVTLVSGSGAGPYLLSFSPRIPLGAWTKITAVNVVDAASGTPISATGNKIVLGNLPMDVTQDGKVLGDDINRWQAINNNFYNPAPLTKLQLLDQKRDGVVGGPDINRAIQLINGIGTFRVWNGFDLGAKPQ